MLLLRLFLYPLWFCRNCLLILCTKQMGIQFCDGPYIVRINLLISVLHYFGTVVIIWLMFFVCKSLH